VLPVIPATLSNDTFGAVGRYTLENVAFVIARASGVKREVGDAL
jgi:hypothetical protein